MKFIIPKNYKYNAKIFGFIDYITAIFDLVVGIILFNILHIIFQKLSTQIYIFIILFLPVILFSIFATQGENILEYILTIVRFIKNRGVYLYEKDRKVENSVK